MMGLENYTEGMVKEVAFECFPGLVWVRHFWVGLVVFQGILGGFKIYRGSTELNHFKWKGEMNFHILHLISRSTSQIIRTIYFHYLVTYEFKNAPKVHDENIAAPYNNSYYGTPKFLIIFTFLIELLIILEIFKSNYLKAWSNIYTKYLLVTKVFLEYFYCDRVIDEKILYNLGEIYLSLEIFCSFLVVGFYYFEFLGEVSLEEVDVAGQNDPHAADDDPSNIATKLKPRPRPTLRRQSALLATRRISRVLNIGLSEFNDIRNSTSGAIQTNNRNPTNTKTSKKFLKKLLSLTQLLIAILPLQFIRLITYTKKSQNIFTFKDNILFSQETEFSYLDGHCWYGYVPSLHFIGVKDISLIVFCVMGYVFLGFVLYL